MNKIFFGVLYLTLLSHTAFAEECKFAEGDDFTAGGSYLMADSCTLYGNIEAVNKTCSKVKVRIAKVTQAFGMRVDAVCRVNGGEGAAGDVIWLPIAQNAPAASRTESTVTKATKRKKAKRAPQTESQQQPQE